MKPLQPDRTVEWVHESELDADGNRKPDATVWHLRPMTHEERTRIDDAAGDYVHEEGRTFIRARPAEAAYRRARCGLASAPAGWPVKFEAGPFLPYSRRPCATAEFLDSIPPEVVDAMGARVESLSRLSTGEGQPSSPSSGDSPRTAPGKPSPTAAPAAG